MSSNVNENPLRGFWPLIAPYAVPPVAAGAAIVPAFRDLVAKSDQQKGELVRKMMITEWLKGGFKTAPTVGVIVGTQMVLQSLVEKALVGEKESLSSKFASSAIVGLASSPFLAVFNGQTIGWSVLESLRRFTAKQCLAISVQEAAFVGGLSAADKLADFMKRELGDNKAVEYGAAFTTGALCSLAGHPANTALTRWQSGMKVDSLRQLMWGAARKARAIGIFSVAYKCGKEMLNSTVRSSQ